MVLQESDMTEQLSMHSITSGYFHLWALCGVGREAHPSRDMSLFQAWPAAGCLFTTYWRCRVSETVGLPGSPCFQPPYSKLEAGFWVQDWALRTYSKPF